MKKGEPKQTPSDDLRMPADEFDRIMGQALGVPAPVEATSRLQRQPRKGGRPAKK